MSGTHVVECNVCRIPFSIVYRAHPYFHSVLPAYIIKLPIKELICSIIITISDRRLYIRIIVTASLIRNFFHSLHISKVINYKLQLYNRFLDTARKSLILWFQMSLKPPYIVLIITRAYITVLFTLYGVYLMTSYYILPDKNEGLFSQSYTPNLPN